MRNRGGIMGVALAVGITVLAIAAFVVWPHGEVARDEGLWSDATEVLSEWAVRQTGGHGGVPLTGGKDDDALALYFALAGVAAGCLMGYSWKVTMASQPGRQPNARSRRWLLGSLTVVGCLLAAWVQAFVRPLLDPGLGDVVLFAFAMGGTAGGLLAGSGLGEARAARLLERKAPS